MADALIVDLESFAITDAEQYVEPVDAPSNYKDPIKIAEYIKTAQGKSIDRCALDPDLARIVALGWMFPSDAKPIVVTCKDERQEREALEMFWREAVDVNLVTFNGLRFDLPMLMRRSQYLRLAYPLLNLDKYRTPHRDLMSILTFNGAINAHSLKFYLSRFGIASDDITTGKDIAALVKAGDWDGVKAHCASDVLGTKRLAERIGVIRPVVREAAGVM
jgi:predicted PolB exonuclease-like 3'-5' exonuclease